MSSSEDITVLLKRMRCGDKGAADDMLPLVYDQLRGLAGYLMRGQPAHTLQPTALVNEAWMKIQGALEGGSQLADRRHFQAVASRAMRQVLVNHARDRNAQKRGGNVARVSLDECIDLIESDTGNLTEWSEILDQLAIEHQRPARVVELRVFGGMTIEEVATALDLSAATVKVDWRFARAWIKQAMGPDR